MSKIFKAILKFIKAVVKKIVNFIKKFWWVIAIVLLIWFAPVIAGWLLSSGAPAWLSGAFGWVATTITPGLVTAGTWITETVGSIFGEGSLWSSLSLGTKASIALGASALIMPEETADLVSGVAEGVVDVGLEIGSAIVGGAFAGLPLWSVAAMGVGAYLLFFRKGKETYVQVSD